MLSLNNFNNLPHLESTTKIPHYYPYSPLTKMKILTLNFLTCAVKTCKTSPASFPLHFRDAELESLEMEYNPTFIRNILPRIDWEALKGTVNEVCVCPFSSYCSTNSL